MGRTGQKHDTAMKTGTKALIFCGVVGAIVWAMAANDSDDGSPLTDAKTPQEVVAALLAKEARPRTQIDGERATVSYSIKPYALTVGVMKSTFNHKAAAITENLFAKFPAIRTIDITATGEFKDLRGNLSEDKALSIQFTRANADRIRWSNIDISNVPKIADRYWAHPGNLAAED